LFALSLVVLSFVPSFVGLAVWKGRGSASILSGLVALAIGPTSLKREEGPGGGGGGGKRKDKRVSHMSRMLKLHSPPMIMVA
jgi:hypothetical protein